MQPAVSRKEARRPRSGHTGASATRFAAELAQFARAHQPTRRAHRRLGVAAQKGYILAAASYLSYLTRRYPSL